MAGGVEGLAEGEAVMVPSVGVRLSVEMLGLVNRWRVDDVWCLEDALFPRIGTADWFTWCLNHYESLLIESLFPPPP